MGAATSETYLKRETAGNTKFKHRVGAGLSNVAGSRSLGDVVPKLKKIDEN